MTDLKHILRWYTGKARARIETEILPLLALAEEQGYWPPGASRKVVAALNKQAVANKFARSQDRSGYGGSWKRKHEVLIGEGYSGKLCDVVSNRRNPYCGEGGDLVFAMEYGQFQRARDLLATCKKCLSLAKNDAEIAAVAEATRWCADFALVADIVKLLDSRRPPRKVVLGTLSPTVAANLVDGIRLDVSTVRMPKMVGKWVEEPVYDKSGRDTGRKHHVYIIEIIWPKNVRHGSSRYRGTATNSQCEACGHAIKSPWNWVPLLIDDEKKIPHSFWVGSDCAKKLFGATVEGEGLYAERMPKERK